MVGQTTTGEQKARERERECEKDSQSDGAWLGKMMQESGCVSVGEPSDGATK